MERQSISPKIYQYNPAKDLINEETYIYTGIKGDFVGICAFILAVLNIALSVLLYKFSLFVSVFVLFAVWFQRRSYRSAASSAAYYCAVLALVISLAIWGLTVVVYGG